MFSYNNNKNNNKNEQATMLSNARGSIYLFWISTETPLLHDWNI